MGAAGETGVGEAWGGLDDPKNENPLGAALPPASALPVDRGITRLEIGRSNGIRCILRLVRALLEIGRITRHQRHRARRRENEVR